MEGISSVDPNLMDIDSCRKVIKDQKNGILMPFRDPNALAEALYTLLIDTKLAAEMGRKGRATAKLHFDEKKVFDKVLQTYQDQLNRKLPS